MVPVLATLLVGSLLVVGARTMWPTEACGPDELAAQALPQLGSSSIRVEVLSSSNKSAVMEEMACRFERASPRWDERPIDVVISSEASGEAYQRIGEIKPIVWTPAATSWVSMLRQDHKSWVPEQPPSIAQSPQVIAMPRPIAEELGWPDDPLGWSDIVAYATDKTAWHADSQQTGAFRLGKTNPRLSTSGLNSTVATFAAKTDTSADMSVEQLDDPSVLAFVHAVESAAVHYAPTSVDFLRNLRVQDDLGNGDGYVSAILLEEKSVWDYNHGNPSGDPTTVDASPPPRMPLVAFYPEEGALVADHPYVVLDGDWVTDDQRRAAELFKDFLLADEQQERFRALGFRDHQGMPGPEIAPENGLLPQQPIEELQPPGGDVLQAIRERWPEYRKRARMLIVMDVSGSMNGRVPGSDRTKLELAQAAALKAIRQLDDHDQVGLWVYSPASSSDPFVKLVPTGDVSTNGAALRRAIGSLRADPGNRSALCSSVTAAVDSLRESFDPKKINGIILLSDGPDEGSVREDCARMLTAVKPPEPDKEVRIFTIAYGDAAEVETLADLAHASLGTAYDATDPTDIGKVFFQVVANF
jgi:Ca-activated chloride channel family protein